MGVLADLGFRGFQVQKVPITPKPLGTQSNAPPNREGSVVFGTNPKLASPNKPGK